MNDSTQAKLQRQRVLSGMRPTGKLHLGNYMGALYNWLRLQHQYECYFFIADWHALTTDYADTSRVKENVLEVALDWLGAGLDPERCTIFVQSWVPQHAELHLLFSMITPLGWLERVPSYKEQQQQIGDVAAGGKDLSTYGFLGYPLLQSADILIYQADFVPVGQDQVAHVELTREVARRFNFFYPRGGRKQRDFGKRPDKRPMIVARWEGEEVLPEPQHLLTPSPKLPGTDGRKMSKSYGNTILLSDPESEIRAKLKTMVTDPARIRRSDSGNPDVCPVFDLHKIFSSEQTQQKAREGCTTAGIGCIECKRWLADGVVTELAPIQERRRTYESKPGDVWNILQEGSANARARAEVTMQQVREAMHLAPANSPTGTPR
ncbi:MAG TPA: tryptophan--tRNA ligase [Acidobacteriaceae bacterium]|nr:tryptophan--tRNA ligase [Acidobacteriaceae bacterium]